MDGENGGYLTQHCKSCEYWLDNSWDFGCGNPQYSECRHLNPVEIEESVKQHNYLYNGPVFIFGNCIQSRWRGKTKAVSRAKAKANLTYQWKKEHGYAPNAAISLPGRVVMTE